MIFVGVDGSDSEQNLLKKQINAGLAGANAKQRQHGAAHLRGDRGDVQSSKSPRKKTPPQFAEDAVKDLVRSECSFRLFAWLLSVL